MCAFTELICNIVFVFKKISVVNNLFLISEPFKIKSGVRQEDGLSSVLFSCILEKVIRGWRERISVNEVFRIGRGKRVD